MKHIIILSLLIAFSAFVLRVNHEVKPASPDVPLPFVELLPDEIGNYRSASLSEKQLRSAVAQLPIQRVVRLNGNGKDAGAMTIKQEQKVCDELGIELITIPAHDGYIKGVGYTQSARMVQRYLIAGGTLLHCKHGFDRTGAYVGYHLRQLGWSKNEIIKFNNWENYLEKKGEAYLPYWETALGGGK